MKGIIPFVASMIIFSTIGVVVREIDLASSERALMSSALGCFFLAIVFVLQKRRLQWQMIVKKLPLLLLCSVALSGNWIFLYASYDYTTIANATLGYYFAPVFALMLAPFVLKEQLSKKKIYCILLAIVGLLLVVTGGHSEHATNHVLGIGLSIVAALFYATLLLLTQRITQLDRLACTTLQLGLAALLLAPYVLLTEGVAMFSMSSENIPFLLTLGIVNTGIGFWLFFSGIEHLNTQRSAVLSYVDPLATIILSVFFLQEPMTLVQSAGGLLLLGATLFSELPTHQLIYRISRKFL